MMISLFADRWHDDKLKTSVYQWVNETKQKFLMDSFYRFIFSDYLLAKALYSEHSWDHKLKGKLTVMLQPRL